MPADASFAPLKTPSRNLTTDDLARAFVATGVPQALAAAGTTAADAAAIAARFTTVTAADGAKGVILPASDLAGHTRLIRNAGSQSLLVYPDSGGTIDGQAADLPVSVGPNQTEEFVKTAALTWAVFGAAPKSYSATATAAGTTTGTIPTIGRELFVTVTSGDANHIVTLPAPVPGTRVTLVNGATGYELRSSAPATVAINGGAAANAESAIAATMVVHAMCVSATRWVAFQQAAAGTVTAVEAAAA